ncbi:GMC family oxidoreductase [Cucumibacter marinus]|uniref:GMC family oxidoreductase n=1 Tax=Cucumibacter marinus TaxID=1121252 RepID=UPI0004196291|nr:GMC family oxidoreductase [Cucumibacter marinus]
MAKRKPGSDIVIVGGGVAGLYAARCLADDFGFTVTLVEAGSANPHKPGVAPGAWQAAAGESAPGLPVHLSAEGEDTAPFGVHTASGLGGGLSQSGQDYLVGQRQDYFSWSHYIGTGREWSYIDLLPHLKSVETNRVLANSYHGAKGPIAVDLPGYLYPGTREFLLAAQSRGHGVNPDFNGEIQMGSGLVPQMRAKSADRPERFDPVEMVAGLADKKGPVHIVTDAVVTGLTFEGNRVTGVEYRKKGKGRSREIVAEREVLLAAGAIANAKLMLLSGIGPGDELKQIGVAPRVELKGVGDNLQIHPMIPLVTRALDGVPHVDPVKAAKSWRDRLNYRWFGGGPLSVAGDEAAVFFDPLGNERPGMEMRFAPFLHRALAGSGVARDGAMSLMVSLLRPRARGRVQLSHSDPARPARITYDALGNETDAKLLIAGLKRAREIFLADPLASLVEPDFALGPENWHEDSEIAEYCRAQLRFTGMPAGTARMGPDHDPLAVLDPQLRVRGTEGLRVIDASAMPFLTSGAGVVPALAIAGRAAQVIARAHGRETRKPVEEPTKPAPKRSETPPPAKPRDTGTGSTRPSLKRRFGNLGKASATTTSAAAAAAAADTAPPDTPNPDKPPVEKPAAPGTAIPAQPAAEKPGPEEAAKVETGKAPASSETTADAARTEPVFEGEETRVTASEEPAPIEVTAAEPAADAPSVAIAGESPDADSAPRVEGETRDKPGEDHTPSADAGEKPSPETHTEETPTAKLAQDPAAQDPAVRDPAVEVPAIEEPATEESEAKESEAEESAVDAPVDSAPASAPADQGEHEAEELASLPPETTAHEEKAEWNKPAAQPEPPQEPAAASDEPPASDASDETRDAEERVSLPPEMTPHDELEALVAKAALRNVQKDVPDAVSTTAPAASPETPAASETPEPSEEPAAPVAAEDEAPAEPAAPPESEAPAQETVGGTSAMTEVSQEPETPQEPEAEAESPAEPETAEAPPSIHASPSAEAAETAQTEATAPETVTEEPAQAHEADTEPTPEQRDEREDEPEELVGAKDIANSTDAGEPTEQSESEKTAESQDTPDSQDTSESQEKSETQEPPKSEDDPEPEAEQKPKRPIPDELF